ncbi:MAG: hypothetical protein L0H94_14235 [Nitrospira sp.]|nr:hypothetical protein [Nitrospira sp.]
MKRWILLMKSCEVKAKKQIYLVFSQIAPARRNFTGIIGPSSFVRTLFFDRTHPHKSILTSLSVSIAIS